VPELPELEHLKSALSGYLSGRKILGVIVDPKRSFLLRYPPARFGPDLTGRVFSAVERHGKFLRFTFEDRDDDLYVHAMLGGRFAYCSRAAPPLPATCFTLQLSGGTDLRFLDSSNMARVYLTAEPAADIPTYGDMGPDALDDALTYEVFAARIARHRGEIKSELRNQSVVAGIGNAYADEILWAAKINPQRRLRTLSDTERRALYDAIRSVLGQAAETARAQYAGGKHPLHKQDRSFMQIHLKGRAKSLCPRCGHRISVIHADRAQTYFCRGCQR